jgi:hypothetical protein
MNTYDAVLENGQYEIRHISNCKNLLVWFFRILLIALVVWFLYHVVEILFSIFLLYFLWRFRTVLSLVLKRVFK